MCLIKASIQSPGGGEREIADIVDLVIEGDAIRVKTLFGEAHELRPARLLRGDFGRNILVIQEEP